MIRYEMHWSPFGSKYEQQGGLPHSPHMQFDSNCSSGTDDGTCADWIFIENYVSFFADYARRQQVQIKEESGKEGERERERNKPLKSNLSS